MEKLTEKQERIYRFVKSEIRKKGYPPTVREICDAVSLSSTSTVHAHLEELVRKGYIHRSPTKNRSIEVLDEAFYDEQAQDTSISLPIIERITDGAPLLAAENLCGVFPVPAEFLPSASGAPIFMVRINDNTKYATRSNLPMGHELRGDLREGDLVAVEPDNRGEWQVLAIFRSYDKVKK